MATADLCGEMDLASPGLVANHQDDAINIYFSFSDVEDVIPAPQRPGPK